MAPRDRALRIRPRQPHHRWSSRTLALASEMLLQKPDQVKAGDVPVPRFDALLLLKQNALWIEA